MRLYERTMKPVYVAPRQVRTDGLGGVIEGFSGEMKKVRASVIESTGGLRSREAGIEQAQSMCLLMPLDAKIEPGDGVSEGPGAPQWRVTEARRWSAHIAVQLERIPGC